jgi:uncharacterized OB-fold protein
MSQAGWRETHAPGGGGKAVQARDDIIVFEEALKVPYAYSAGPVVSRFLVSLRDKREILGIRCAKCALVYVPPRAVCGRCMARLDQWVRLSGQGAVESYTTVHYREPYHPARLGEPIHYAIVRLDGADTGFVHLLGEVGKKALRVGMRVEPVFAEQRTGTILDIRYFRPIDRDLARG